MTLKFASKSIIGGYLLQLKFPFYRIVIIINERMMFHDQKFKVTLLSQRRREGADDDYDKYRLKCKWKNRNKYHWN